MLKFYYVDLKIYVREKYVFIDVFTKGLKKELGFFYTKEDVSILSNNLTINDISSCVIFEKGISLNMLMSLKIQSVKKIDIFSQIISCSGRLALNE